MTSRVDGELSVKVGDFGLTRDISGKKYYKLSQGGRIPVKWMAPESLHDGISDEKTDVVSSLIIINTIAKCACSIGS